MIELVSFLLIGIVIILLAVWARGVHQLGLEPTVVRETPVSLAIALNLSPQDYDAKLNEENGSKSNRAKGQ